MSDTILEHDGIAREDRDKDRQFLNAQWERQQVKSFTAWVNGYLTKVGDPVDQIATGFSDGRRLLKLLQVISGDYLKKPEKGKMRLHSIQNINTALDFIAKKGVKLVGISAEEIADCNEKLILGMIWILILRFQIQDISVEEMSAKEGLLLWAQRKTQDYDGCNVVNFHTSFQDGSAFCALIHRHRPDLINYSKVKDMAEKDRLNLAFKVADESLGIPQMLDAEDMLETTRPDERSVMTYVAAYYHTFINMSKIQTAVRRLSTVLEMDREFHTLMSEYEGRCSDLLDWVTTKTNQLSQQEKHESVDEVANSASVFREYKKSEKSPKSQEKAQLEAHYSTLQTKLRLNNRPPYHPVEGQMLSDINKAWKGLATAEKSREVFLRKEQERLESMRRAVQRFRAKAANHHKWMSNRIAKVNSSDYGHDLPSVSILMRQHKAVEQEMKAHGDVVLQLRPIADELTSIGYVSDTGRDIQDRMAEIETEWLRLNGLVGERRVKLQASEKHYLRLDELQMTYSSKAAALMSWVEIVQEDLVSDLGVATLDHLAAAQETHKEYKAILAEKGREYAELLKILEEVEKGGVENPYTTLGRETVESYWEEIQVLTSKRDADLTAEGTNQAMREQLRKDFAVKINAMGDLLNDKLQDFRERASTGTLDEQLATIRTTEAESNPQIRIQLSEIYEMGNHLEELNIYENSYANYTTTEISVLYEQQEALSTKMVNTIENQILMRDQSGITEEQMMEYKASFSHFARDGDLSRNEFHSCLMSIGYDLPEVKAGEEDTAFSKIMDSVSDGSDHVSFEAFVDFMSRDKADSNSAQQCIESFRQIAGEK
eukprot:Ihof_evm6s213 gene=Ihof_evmTU6s213